MDNVVVGSTDTKLSVTEADVQISRNQKVLSPKAIDELREILRKDEDVREFFLLLKNKEMRMQAVDALNAHIKRNAAR